jgi:predicted ester cyclase
MSTNLTELDAALDDVEAHGLREAANVGAAIAALAVAGPAAATTGAPASRGTESALVSSDASRSTQLVQNYFERVWAGDFGAADELTAPGFTIRGPLIAGSGECERIAQAVERYTRAFPDMRFEILEISGAGDSVSIRWVAQGTHEGVLFGLKATGATLKVEGTTTYTLRGRLITEEVYDFDLAALLEQLGGSGR